MKKAKTSKPAPGADGDSGVERVKVPAEVKGKKPEADKPDPPAPPPPDPLVTDAGDPVPGEPKKPEYVKGEGGVVRRLADTLNKFLPGGRS